MSQKNIGFLSRIQNLFQKNKIGEVLVNRGLLSPEQLRYALKQQKITRQNLGKILLSHGLISKGELHTTLMIQGSLRFALALATLTFSLFTLSPRSAQAQEIKDIPLSIAVNALDITAAQGVIQPALFGSGEQRSSDLSAFTKWSAMFDRFQMEVDQPSSQRLIRQWRADLGNLRGRSLMDMVVGVNDLMNHVPYINDSRNWNKSDFWETPIEFLSRGGDCEDFAIAKYASLRALGVPESLMRIAIVKDMQKNIPHAILIVYTTDGPMVLDNQIKSVVSAASILHYKPIFSINRSAWWVHMDRPLYSPTQPTQIASAAR